MLSAAISIGCADDSTNASPAATQDAGSDGAVDAGSEATVDRGDFCTDRSTTAIEVENEIGTLHGTIELPAGCGPFSVVLIVAGSGPTDRDCNSSSLSTDAYEMLAEALADRGIASVRYDKRGIAESGAAGPSNESDYRIEHFVEDAGRWTDLLRSDARFDHVLLGGHSEGALIGMLLARDRTLDAFISLAGTGRSLGDVLREQLARQLPPNLMSEAEAIIAELEQGRTVSDVPPELASLFRPSVQPFLISVFKHNPADLMATMAAPTLVVQGTADIQISVADAELLAAAKPDAKLVMIEEMNHVFKQATTSPSSQQRAYTDPTLPLANGFVDAVASFVSSNPKR